MTPEEKIEVIRAQAAGKTVQTKPRTDAPENARPLRGYYGVWTDNTNLNHDFNFSVYDYRVKPVEPREFIIEFRRGYSTGAVYVPN